MIEQVTTEELFKKCEPYLNMRVNDVQKAAHVLRKNVSREQTGNSNR